MELSERVLAVEPDPFPDPFSAAARASSEAAPTSGIVEKAAGIKVPSSLAGRVIPDLSVSEQFKRIGGSLTPAQLSSIMREADTGNIRRLVDLGNDAKQKDCHLSSVCSQNEETITGLEWKLVLPKNALAREQRAADAIEDHLRNVVAESFTTMLGHLAGAVYFPFAVTEQLWGKFEGRVLPSEFENHSQRRFRFREKDGRLVWWDDGMPVNGVDFREEHPNRFVLAQPRVTGDVPTREGLIRVLLWAALFRNWSITDWLRTGEIAWKPWRIAKFLKGKATEEDISKLIAMLERLATTGTAVLNDGVDLDVKWATGQQSSKATHAEIFNVVAQEMSKAMLGQTETVQSSASTGYAQAKVHFAVRANILRARARHISAVITRDVIRPCTHLNWGDGYAVAAFQLITDEPVDIEKFSRAVKNFAGAGGAKLPIPADWARKTAGIPNPTGAEDEELIGVDTSDEEDPDGEGKDAAPGTDGEPDNKPPPEDDEDVADK